MSDQTVPMTVDGLIEALKKYADEGAGDEPVEARCAMGDGVWLLGVVTKVEDRGGVTLSVEGEDQ